MKDACLLVQIDDTHSMYQKSNACLLSNRREEYYEVDHPDWDREG